VALFLEMGWLALYYVVCIYNIYTHNNWITAQSQSSSLNSVTTNTYYQLKST